MRSITYAGEAVQTSDEVASLLVELSAELAKAGRAEAVEIPIVTQGGGRDTAELVVGLGNDVLSLPAEPEGAEPDFTDAVEMLTAMLDATFAQFTMTAPAATPATALAEALAFDDPAIEPETAEPQIVPDSSPGRGDAAVTSLDEFRRAQRSR
ncbi:hypothetical protein ACFJGV_16160 [Cnuibacter sp. UC19_7]|uniref:hypothetical protein n=1 Tax=Cnuibacter sp. UC19_7 TaxID=3350166 RepID=UPI00366A7B72